ncbi:MAG: hypothetical protein M3Q11_01365, partial [Pseudomonadota bacterium]|nr:hypothetical protein [Pseudomonadota bacterium]
MDRIRSRAGRQPPVHVDDAFDAAHALEFAQPYRLNPRFHAGFSVILGREDLTGFSGPPTRRTSMALERTLSIIKPDAVAKN